MPSRFLSLVALSAALVALPLSSAAAQAPPKAAPPAGAHASADQPMEVKADDLVWKPHGMFPELSVAVVQGDPTKEGHFTIRVRFPDGAFTPPHWHPNTEYLTLLSGTWLYGTGETADRVSARELPAGTFIVSHARAPHYAWSVGASEVQISAMGPLQTILVNPEDDPRKKK